jgi:hypothetical protein
VSILPTTVAAFLTALVLLFAALVSTHAQTPPRVPRIGVIGERNLRTAKALGLTLSPSLVLRADGVIR